MRVDIIRFLILHKCGGLYVDLDVYINPNFELNFSKDIVLQSINEKNQIEIQFIYCKNKGEKFLTDYINTIEDKIIEKDKIEVYKKRIARYIFYTTGPRSFQNFYKTQKIDNDFILIPVERHSTKKLQIIDVKDKIKNKRFIIILSAKWTHTIKELKWKPVINYKF